MLCTNCCSLASSESPQTNLTARQFDGLIMMHYCHAKLTSSPPRTFSNDHHYASGTLIIPAVTTRKIPTIWRSFERYKLSAKTFLKLCEPVPGGWRLRG